MCANGHHMSRFSFATASVRTSSEKRAGVRGAVAVLGLMGTTLTSPSHAQQAPSLLTAGSFAVLAGSTVTNTGSTVINGNVGVSPGSAVTGFPPGIVNGVISVADAVRAVRNVVGIWCGAFSGNMKVSFQAARSIGFSMGFVASVCQPSTLRMLICPEASSAQNNIAAVSADGRTV